MEIISLIPNADDVEQSIIKDILDGRQDLRSIGKKNQTPEICKVALQKGNLCNNLQFVAPELITYELCLVAVQKSGLAIRDVPEDFRDEKMIKQAALQNIYALAEINDLQLRNKIANDLFCENVKAIQFMNPNDLDDSMWLKAISQDYSLLNKLPKRLLTIDLIENAFDSFTKDSEKEYKDISFVKGLPRSKKINLLERKYGVRDIQAFYDPKEEKFFVSREIFPWERTPKSERYKTHQFRTFRGFYRFLKKDLTGADLRFYPFSKKQIQKYNFQGAKLSVDIAKQTHTYSDEYYQLAIGNTQGLNKIVPVLKDEHFLPQIMEHPLTNGLLYHSKAKYFYVSDLHLDQKLDKHFPKAATKFEIQAYLSSVVDQLLNIGYSSSSNCLLIAGDVSHNFEVVKMFFTFLSQRWNYQIVAILGNHELWSFGETYDQLVLKYQKLFDDLSIVFLQNSLMCLKDKKVRIIDEGTILNSSPAQLVEEVGQADALIFGGVGFAGNNCEFNAQNGIYQSTISFEEEIKLTQKTNEVYRRIKDCFENRTVITLTHMPLKDWSNDFPVPGWIYVNGHTHRNMFVSDESKTIYADNQIGYYSEFFSLKSFEVSNRYDPYYNLNDGIYIISHSQYMDFLRAMGTGADFKKRTGTIYMIKRAKKYCFGWRNEKGKLYFLGGGVAYNTDFDLEFYFEYLPRYVETLQMIIGKYNEALKKISTAVKTFGGDGRIHGSIIDIDFYNHIYLNPKTGEPEFYFAVDTSSRTKFNSIGFLLKECSPELYSAYRQLDEKDQKALQVSCLALPTTLAEEFSWKEDGSEMYGPSIFIYRLQQSIDYGIVQRWDNTLLQNYCGLQVEAPKAKRTRKKKDDILIGEAYESDPLS